MRNTVGIVDLHAESARITGLGMNDLGKGDAIPLGICRGISRHSRLIPGAIILVVLEAVGDRDRDDRIDITIVGDHKTLRTFCCNSVRSSVRSVCSTIILCHSGREHGGHRAGAFGRRVIDINIPLCDIDAALAVALFGDVPREGEAEQAARDEQKRNEHDEQLYRLFAVLLVFHTFLLMIIFIPPYPGAIACLFSPPPPLYG